MIHSNISLSNLYFKWFEKKFTATFISISILNLECSLTVIVAKGTQQNYQNKSLKQLFAVSRFNLQSIFKNLNSYLSFPRFKWTI